MARDFIQRIALHLKVHGPDHVIECFADAAGSHGKQDAGAVVVQDERQVGREPRRNHCVLPNMWGDEIPQGIHAPRRIAVQDGADVVLVGEAGHRTGPFTIIGHAMVLAPGARLGSYEIIGPLGAGGMGEVYRARDTALGRDVAIKVLPAVFAQDADRLARFEREARVLGSLNHPNIATLYCIEKVGDGRALVMELVEGSGLGELMRPGAGMRVAEAIAIARQIADALDAAHERGIVHRDLKPANVRLTADGVVKVLDFGLAKSGVEGPSDLTNSPTVIGPTASGVVLGTAPYMSPEQARGKFVDKRTDIWAFGCVLYEMLAGRRAFPGETSSDTIAAILEREPDWSALPASTPLAVRRLLQRCLEKDPKRRLRDIADARADLDQRRSRSAADLRIPAVARVGGGGTHGIDRGRPGRDRSDAMRRPVDPPALSRATCSS